MEAPEAYLLTVDYELYPLHPHSTARNVAIQSCNVTKTFDINLHSVKHMGLRNITAVCPNPHFNELLYIEHSEVLKT
jgi:hypothetical protein